MSKVSIYINNIKKTYERLSTQSKAAFWFVLCNFLQTGMSFLTTPIFTRMMTTDEYGVFNAYNAWQNIVMIFVSLRLASGVYMRGLIKHEDDKERFTDSVQSLFIVIYLVWLFIYVFFRSFWERVLGFSAIYITLMLSDIMFLMVYRFWGVRQRVSFKYGNMVALTLFNTAFKLLLEIIAVYNLPDGAFARALAITAADAISFGYLFCVMLYTSVRGFTVKYWKYALAYNIPLVPHYLSQVVLNQADRIMIKNISGSGNAGIYSLAYSLASVVVILNQAVLNSYNPWMYQQIKKKNYKEINDYSLKLLYIIMGVCILLIIFAPEIILIFAGQKYYDAIWVVPPVTVSVYFTFLYSLFANFEFYYEKNVYMMVASVCAAGLNVLLNQIFITRYGYIAAAYTTIACYLLYTLFHYIVMRMILKKNIGKSSIYEDRKIFLMSAAFTAFGAICLLLYKYVVIRYTLMVVVLVIAFICRKRIMTFIHDMRNRKN